MTVDFEDLPDAAKLSLQESSALDVLLKPLADLNYNRTTHYYNGYQSGVGYFRYDFVWTGENVTGILA